MVRQRILSPVKGVTSDDDVLDGRAFLALIPPGSGPTGLGRSLYPSLGLRFAPAQAFTSRAFSPNLQLNRATSLTFFRSNACTSCRSCRDKDHCGRLLGQPA